MTNTDSSVRFWNRTAEKYARQPIGNPEHYQAKLDMTWQFLDAGMEIFEFGCGTGSTALIHADKVARVLATDTSEAMIDIANGKLADGSHGNVEFRCADIFDPSLDNAVFDAVLGLNVLHLIDNYAGTIRRAFELTKPGGYFFSGTVCFGTWSPFKLILPLGGALGLIPRVQFIEAEQLDRAITDAGFVILDRISTGSSVRSEFIVAQRPR